MTSPDTQPLIIAAEERADFDVIVNWVTPGARVLDLGCGTGELMERLVREKGAIAQGVDLHQPSITTCIIKGLSVFHGDLHEGLADLRNDSFDFVVLSRTLQQVPDPDVVIRNMLRVGAKAIVSFPNFAYWRIRLHLLLHGTLPVSPALPYAWYNTPNIRLITIADFEKFCAEQSYAILNHVALNLGNRKRARVVSQMCDLCGEYGMFLLGRK
ncbi:MAG: methionine biosynthesis protein MetW [Armatimonadota bacterium]